MVEKILEVSTQDGTMPTFVTHPELGPPFPVVVFYMDVFGIRDELKDMCRRLTDNGMYIIGKRPKNHGGMFWRCWQSTSNKTRMEMRTWLHFPIYWSF